MSAGNVSLEFTPNPMTLKYVVDSVLLETGSVNFLRMDDATDCPPALRLFAISGVEAVMVGKNFVTITKSESADWGVISTAGMDIVKKAVTSGEPFFKVAPELVQRANTVGGDATEIILRVIDNEIRPAVAMDGGDIIFDRYEDGIVYLHMQGSCAGCPSSTMTLKMGIEARLKEVLPEIKEVIAL